MQPAGLWGPTRTLLRRTAGELCYRAPAVARLSNYGDVPVKKKKGEKEKKTVPPVITSYGHDVIASPAAFNHQRHAALCSGAEAPSYRERK